MSLGHPPAVDRARRSPGPVADLENPTLIARLAACRPGHDMSDLANAAKHPETTSALPPNRHTVPVPQALANRRRIPTSSSLLDGTTDPGPGWNRRLFHGSRGRRCRVRQERAQLLLDPRSNHKTTWPYAGALASRGCVAIEVLAVVVTAAVLTYFTTDLSGPTIIGLAVVALTVGNILFTLPIIGVLLSVLASMWWGMFAFNLADGYGNRFLSVVAGIFIFLSPLPSA